MKLIVITTEYFFSEESAALNNLFENGMTLLHLRKPEATQTETARLIEQIHSQYHPHIVIHDHFSLATAFHLKGIHLNRRNCNIPQGFQGSISASCHSLDELAAGAARFDYIFLSPIFNSISKENYTSRFSESLLNEAKERGVINEKIIALGGVTPHNILTARACGFGGVAVLGGLWEDFPTRKNSAHLLTRFKEFHHAAD